MHVFSFWWRKLRLWWDVWFFVIMFPICFILFLLGWYYFASWSPYKFLDIVIAIFFLFGSLVMGISTLIAISEDNYFVSAFLLLLIGVVVGVIGYAASVSTFQLNFERLTNDFYANISTELVSVVITVLAIDSLKGRISWRKVQRENSNEQARSSPEIQFDKNSESTADAGADRQSQPILRKTGRNFVSLTTYIVIAFLLGIIVAKERRSK